MEKKRVTVSTVKEMKAAGKPIAMLTAYDYSMARLLDEAGVDMLLVGDSLGNVVLGYESTIPVTVEDMVHHGAAVCRGAKRAMVVVDMPFLSYQVSVEDAVRNAGRIFKETGAQAVKLEGGAEMAQTVVAIVRAGIPVVEMCIRDRVRIVPKSEEMHKRCDEFLQVPMKNGEEE